MIDFYDSANFSAIPDDSYALVYVGGSFAPSAAELKRLKRIYRLTELAGRPDLAKAARGIAVEPGAASVQDAIRFGFERHKLGHKDFTVYTSFGRGEDPSHQPGMAGMVEALKNARVPYFRIHVAEWDGNPSFRPQVGNVAAWAKQYRGNVNTSRGQVDVSRLYGKNDFVRP